MDPSSKTISSFENAWSQYPIAQAMSSFLTSPEIFCLRTVSSSLRRSLKANGALRKLSTHSDPLSMERVMVVASDIVEAGTIQSLALNMPQIEIYVRSFDTSYLTQLVLDGSCAGELFFITVVQSSRRLKLLSVKHCNNIPLAAVEYLLDGRVPETLETLMVWGLPCSNWLLVESTQGVLATDESRMASRGIVAIIDKARDQGIDLDTKCCIAKSDCRGLTWALRRMEFEPDHAMFQGQAITNSSIFMCEKRKVICDSCRLVKDTVACQECMTDGLMRLGFCNNCRRYMCEKCLDMFPPNLFCPYCPPKCGRCYVKANDACANCHGSYCASHEITSQCPTCLEEFCWLCSRSNFLKLRCFCGCKRIVCRLCQRVSTCMTCGFKMGGCTERPYYRCFVCMISWNIFEDKQVWSRSESGDSQDPKSHAAAEEGSSGKEDGEDDSEKGNEQGVDPEGDEEVGEDGEDGEDEDDRTHFDGSSVFGSDSDFEDQGDGAFYF